jgi:hypothetical protein
MALGAVFNPHQGRNRLLFLGKAHPKLRDDQLIRRILARDNNKLN